MTECESDGPVAVVAGAGPGGFLAPTDGYLQPDADEPTLADVAANWAAVNDEAGYYVPTSTLNWAARSMSHRF